MFMSTTFLTNAVVINVKSMKGNTYVILVSLYVVEVIAGICCGFLINLPSLGRKKSLIGFYLGITLGFIITLILQNSAIGCWLAMVLIRFCITGVYTTFYIYFMENYPTPLRSLGFGLNSTFGNLAGIVSPLIIEFMNKYLLYLIFAILSGINILLTFFLKETVGKPMLETIEELDADVDKEKLVPGRDSDMRPSDASEKKEPLIKEKYVFYYSPWKNEEAEKIALHIGKKKGLKVVSSLYQGCKGMSYYLEAGPCEFLNLFVHADYLVGKSFHLVVFSLLFHKKFLAINGMNDFRIKNILLKYDLQQRGIASIDDCHQIIDDSIDYVKIDSIMERERKESMSFLHDNLLKSLP